MRSTIATLGCIVAGALGLLALPATTAHADTTATIPQLTGFHQIVVDSADNYAFLSEGISSIDMLNGAASSSAIVVTDLSGSYITTLDAGDGVEGLALSSDGSTLYAALAATDQVAAIGVASGSITSTTTTPTQTLYDLGTGDIPYSVALQSGKIWMSYLPASLAAGASAIGAIDPTSSTFESGAVPSEYWYSPADLSADPGNDNVLVAAAPDEDPVAVTTFSTAIDPGTALATTPDLGNGSSGTSCAFENQLVVLAGGSQFIAACGYPSFAYTYSTTDLANPVAAGPTFKSPGPGSPVALAIGTTGTVAVGFASSLSAVDVYQPDGTLLNVVSLPSTVALASAGLAWSADDTQLFAVTRDNTAGTYSLAVFDHPTVTGSTLTLNGPAVVTFGANVTIAGKLSLTTGAPPAGTGLTVVRTEAGSSATKTFPVTTGAGGSFTVTDPRPALGKYTYTATYAGNTTTTMAKTAVGVAVERTVPYVAIKTSAANTTYGDSVTVTATLGPTFADRWISIYAGPASEAKRLLKTARVNAQGNLTVSYVLSRNTTFFAVFAGDAHNTPRTVSRSVGVWVKVYMSNSGYFKTVVISRVPYRVYHHTAHLGTYARVVPNKAGECVVLEVQQYASQIGWFPNVTFGCFKLNQLSEVATSLGLLQAGGAQYRMRADYVRGRDATNLSTDGSWFYFEVVN